MFKQSINIVLLLVFSLIGLALRTENKNMHAKKWGFAGHIRINRIAVFTLPPELFGFYKEHIEYISEHAPDPDKRRYAVVGEAECHYIDIDHYVKAGEDPFAVVPKKWDDAVKKYSEDTLRAYGIVPWHIQLVLKKLERAFAAKNVDLILKYSADLGHYIGDAHVPLHTTENYNGQMSNQRGIHGFWETRLVELNYNTYDYFVGKAKYVKDPLDLAWNAVKTSHLALDSVFRFEKELTAEFPPDKKYAYEQRGKMTIQTYSYDFSQTYNKRLNGMVERRMKDAIIAVGSMWYTAWVNAGQPDLSTIQNAKPSEALLNEFKELEKQYQEHKAKGRICD